MCLSFFLWALQKIYAIQIISNLGKINEKCKEY
jgi:hypothetical protein